MGEASSWDCPAALALVEFLEKDELGLKTYPNTSHMQIHYAPNVGRILISTRKMSPDLCGAMLAGDNREFIRFSCYIIFIVFSRMLVHWLF